MIPLLLLVCWLGARHLNTESLWYDEVFTLRFVGGLPGQPMNFSQIWAAAASEPYWPPGYHFALATWGAALGWSPFAARAFSLFFGLLTVAMTYRLGKDLTGNAAVGFAGAAILGAGAFYSYYLHELRGYTLYTFVTVLALWAYWRAARASAKPGVWPKTALFIGGVGLFYVHYFGIFIFLAVGLYHLLFSPKDRRWREVTGIAIASGIAFLPFAISAAAGLSAAYGWQQSVTTVSHLDAPQAIEKLALEFSSGSIALFAVLLFFAFNGRGKAALYAGFVLITALVITLIVDIRLQLLIHIRYMIGLWPLLAASAGIGIVRLGRGRAAITALIFASIAGGLWLNFNDQYRLNMNGGAFWHIPWQQLQEAVEPHAQAGDLAVMHLRDIVWRWMHDPLADYYFHDSPAAVEIMESLPDMSDEDYLALEHRYIDGTNRVWFAFDPTQIPERRELFESELGRQFVLCGTVADTAEISLRLYTRVPDAPAPADMTYRFGDSVGAALLEPLPAVADRSLLIPIVWSGGDIPPETYSFVLHLLDENGALAAQFDAGLPISPYACQLARIEVDSLAPGNYALMLVVYNWHTGERMPVPNSVDNQHPLGTVRVE